MSRIPTSPHRSHRGSGLLSGFASLFGSMPLSVFPPRKSAWEQSGDDIRAVWQDVGDSLRWSMDEYDREHGLELEREHEIELRIERGIKLTLSQLQQLQQLKLELARTKAQKQGKAKASVRKAEDRACA